MRLGENVNSSKLTLEQVLEIRSKYVKGKRGAGYASLAKEYGVAKVTVKSIVEGKTWNAENSEELVSGFTPPTLNVKVCSQCSAEKEIDLFAKKNGKPTARCKECHNRYHREQRRQSESYEKHKSRLRQERADNPLRAKARKYGVSEDELRALASSYENGLCPICKVREVTCVDHCHETGRVRGMLCNVCNVGLGMLGDNVDGLRTALLYLEASQS